MVKDRKQMPVKTITPTRGTPSIPVACDDDRRVSVNRASAKGERRRNGGLARPNMPDESGNSDELFGLLVNGARDHAIFMLDRAGNVISWNTGAERMKGYRADEILQRHFSCFYQLEDVMADKPASDLTKAAAHGGFEDEGWRVRKDGSRYWASIVISALRDGAGNLRGFAKVSRDITTHKEAVEARIREAHLERRTVELTRSNEDLQQFAYVAAHDLQEPLRMIASYTQLLAQRYKGRLDADADEFIAYAVDGAQRMQRLIADLLAYCRVGTTQSELCATSSEAALNQACNNLRSALQESGATVTRDPMPMVTADSGQLTQLFQNLVSNAIKYRRAEPPRVHISAAKQSGSSGWVFTVRDNGLGIDERYFERIFVMFQRLHARNEFSGTGIGLSMCKKIVERHGGRIWVESAPGQGSTFFFSLPSEA
jgi:chemotaxis family two-component system sensor kinase Cph1